MKRTACWLMAATVLVGCDENATQPTTAACTDDTGILSVSVSSADPPVIDWEPDCGVAMVLIEEGASDQWGISTDDALWEDPIQSNLIEPPLTYGTVPPGAEQFGPPEMLRAGVTYEVIIWRVLPEGSSADCVQRFESSCLAAVHEFQR